MCLYAKDSKPRVATKNIKVYKHVKYVDISNRTAITPYQDIIFKLDKEFIPKTKVAKDTTTFTSGVIHAYLWPDTDKGTYLEAYIPKGTNYWIGVDGCTVCAEKLFVTSNKVEGPACMDVDLAKEILTDVPTVEGITIGEFTSDNYIVVGFYQDGKPMIADIANMIQNVAIDKKYNSKIDEYYGYGESVKDFNGISHCTKHPKGERYEAFNAVSKLSPKHYIPACGEMRTLLSNIIYIAASCALRNIPISISTGSWYWTSSEFSWNHNWSYGIDSMGVFRSWYFKSYRGQVVPFVSSVCLFSERINKSEPYIRKWFTIFCKRIKRIYQ